MGTGRGIADITPLTLLDFPNKVACIFWLRGCNLFVSTVTTSPWSEERALLPETGRTTLISSEIGWDFWTG